MSNSGDGFNMAAMMASIAVGGAVGQNVAGTMNNMMRGMEQITQAGAVPPSMDSIEYYVAFEGRAMGPYNMAVLIQMVKSGQLTVNNLVWHAGMENWEKAGSVDDLKSLFITMPPIPPADK